VVLIFAYHYPPENSIGGERPFRFSKYLSRLGYTCRVFTAADQTERVDPNTEFILDPFFTDQRRRLSWQFERALRKILLPGGLGAQWSYHAYRAAQRYLQRQSNTSVTLFSTFPPVGSHLAAWQLARCKDLPWIADFRDPMLNEILDKALNPFQRRVDQWLEQIIIRRSEAVIANTGEALARWQEKYPPMKGKVHLIWNGFDPEDRVSPLPGSFGECRVLSHIGELYCGRSATPILESIARLIAAKRLPAAKVRVRLIGPVDSEALPNQEFLGCARNDGWLELIAEKIPKSDARQIARSSDSLLLLQPQSSTQVPGKLFEYLQIGRPILAFIPPGSASQQLLEQSGVPYRCVYPGSSPAEVDEIVMEFFHLPSVAVAPNSWFEEQFNAEKQTRVLDTIIRTVHQQLPRGAATISKDN
jgi:hypothetical protein